MLILQIHNTNRGKHPEKVVSPVKCLVFTINCLLPVNIKITIHVFLNK